MSRIQSDGRRRWRWLVLALAVAGAAPFGGQASTQARLLPLVAAEHVTWVGAFKLPAGSSEQDTYDWGGTALAYDAARGSLFVVGHDWFQKIGEVGVPDTLATEAQATTGTLPVAPIKQGLTDALEGRLKQIGEGTTKIGGILPWGQELIVSAFLYYDASAAQSLSHFRTGMDFSRQGDVVGPVRVGDRAGFVSGYMTPIPSEWQPDLGGAALTGQCCIPIIGRTSFGPSVSVFDPAQVGYKTPVSAPMVLGYPAEHPSLGGCEETNQLFNCATSMGGAVLPAGTRSLLFFGRQGAGPYCYGEGGANGTCKDPSDGSKGTHAYPYLYQVWAYDVQELAQVRAGRKRAWDVRPYKTWTLCIPGGDEARHIYGATYDAASGRLFLSTGLPGGGRAVHVFTISTARQPTERPGVQVERRVPAATP